MKKQPKKSAILQKDTPSEPAFSRPISLRDVENHYCAGCGHGIIHRLVAEVIDELGVREKTIGIAPVGCAVFAYDYFNFDVTEAPHGRRLFPVGSFYRLMLDGPPHNEILLGGPAAARLHAFLRRGAQREGPAGAAVRSRRGGPATSMVAEELS